MRGVPLGSHPFYYFIFICSFIMYNKYYQIKSCYERENKETKKKEVVLIWNEIKWKGLLSSFSNFFTLSPEDFTKKFWTHVKPDEYNKWLERKNLEVWCETMFEVHWIIDDLPEKLK